MSEKNDKVVSSNENGSINFSNDVLAKIASLAVDEVEGVKGTSGGNLSDMLGVKNRGIHISIEEDVVCVDLNIVVEYGKKLQEVSKSVQENVKKSIENMTGLKVEGVNVNVNSLHMDKPKEEPKEQKEPKE